MYNILVFFETCQDAETMLVAGSSVVYLPKRSCRIFTVKLSEESTQEQETKNFSKRRHLFYKICQGRNEKKETPSIEELNVDKYGTSTAM